MHYMIIKQGTFLERPNRFVANILVDGAIETVHVKNTGRCKELLVPGVPVVLEKAPLLQNSGRKTKYSLVSIYKGDMLINIDSQVPNGVVYEALQQGRLWEFGKPTRIAKEVCFGNSRFDLYYETRTAKGFVEVKGVTLERNGILFFPDAPTKRGSKHVYELIEAVKSGYEACIFFLIQMQGATRFEPNPVTDPQFAEALHQAYSSGVKIMAYDSLVTEDEIQIGTAVPIQL
ncbi:MAG TPA: DNA/RNA nuclease SfsA [Bacillota bacterium]|nr:DNA/RNA nuclease SfsA [Bacillota bacterium]